MNNHVDNCRQMLCVVGTNLEELQKYNTQNGELISKTFKLLSEVSKELTAIDKESKS